MSTYIKSYKYLNDENIRFELDTGKIFNYRYRKYSEKNQHYLANKEGLNYELFIALGIKNPYEWAEDILGYRLCDTGWPEAKSKEDLLKLIDALLKYNNPKYCLQEDYPILSFYNIDKTVVTFKELNVHYYLHSGNSYWWTTSDFKNENYIFTQLKITDKNKWIKNIQGYYITDDEDYFPASETKEDAYKVMDALIAEYIKQFQPKTTIKTNSYGDSKIELRRKKADIRVGSCPAGGIIYGKRSKASVRSRRVSYQTCIGS